MNNRIKYFFNDWYQPDVYMSRDDWLYIACLLVGANLSFGLGLVIGFLISR
jgi:hypothetical protein